MTTKNAWENELFDNLEKEMVGIFNYNIII